MIHFHPYGGPPMGWTTLWVDHRLFGAEAFYGVGHSRADGLEAHGKQGDGNGADGRECENIPA